jgi:hypothetical protein
MQDAGRREINCIQAAAAALQLLRSENCAGGTWCALFGACIAWRKRMIALHKMQDLLRTGLACCQLALAGMKAASLSHQARWWALLFCSLGIAAISLGVLA